MDSHSNVFLIILDTVRKKSTSVYNDEKDTTPFLSSFSNDTVVFENAVSQAPWTLPSHASMFTGKYPSEHGAVQENPHLSKQPTLASQLGNQGYRCGVFSANAWISPHTGLTYGFDTKENFLGSMPSPIHNISSRVWKRFTSSDRLKPLAKRLSSFISYVHRKFTGKRIESYTPDILSEAKNYVSNNEEYDMFVCINLLDAHLPYTPKDEYVPSDIDRDVCLDSKQYNAGVADISEQNWENIRQLYEGEIRYLDDKVSEFIQFLKEQDMYDDSMIIVASDHGELHGKGGVYGHEFAMYDELLNVPLMIKRPNGESDTISENVEMMDLYHTVLEFAGSEDFVPERSIFNSSYRNSESENLQFPDYAFSEYSKPMIALHQIEKIAKKKGLNIDNDMYRSSMKSVRDRNGKYIYRSEVDDLLFSYENDPDENDNIMGDGNSSRYISVLNRHNRTSKVDVERKGVDAIDDSIEDRLEELGYLE